VYRKKYDEEQGENKTCALCLRRWFFLFITLDCLTALFELLLPALIAARFALRASDDVDDNPASVLAA